MPVRNTLVVIALAAILLVVFDYSYAISSDYSEYVTTVECGESKVSVTSVCRNFRDTEIVFCSSQQIELIAMNKKIPVEHIGKLYDNTDVEKNSVTRDLDFLLVSVKCAACDTGKYYILEYTNGGNCDTCERYEIVGRDGTKIASWKEFDATYKKICKNQSEFSSGFIDVKTNEVER